MIRMTHPLHGAMYCYLDSEVENNKKNGWIVEEEKPVLQMKPPEEVPIKSLEEQYEEKFGKKPHWKMKRETIENVLKE